MLGGIIMHKSVKWIICGILALALIVLACLFFIPHATTLIDQTFEVKIHDGSGNIEGTVPITVNGTWKHYLLQEDHLVLTVYEFEHYYDIRPMNPIPGDPPFFRLDDTKADYHSVCFVASSTITGEDSVLLFVQFKKDLSGWYINPMANPGVVSEKFMDHPSFRRIYIYNWWPGE